MLFLSLILTFMLSSGAHAQDKAATELPAAKADQSDAELVTHRRTLATQLGLTDQDVDFGKPRNFKENELNELQLEPEATPAPEPKAK